MALMRKLQVGALLLTSGLVVIMGFFTFLGLLSNPYDDLYPEGPLTTRAPAGLVSVVSDPGKVQLADKKMSRLDLNCIWESRSVKLTSRAKQVQIVGKLCGRGQLSQVKVFNRSNGFEATTFQASKNVFMSDYVYLSEGDNQVLVSLRGDGADTILVNLSLNREVEAAPN